jgi:hypothetical protein
MKKSLWLLGLLVFIFAGCDNPADSGTKDTWSEVMSMSQLEGTWKGKQSQSIPLITILEESGLLESYGPEMAPTIREAVKGINVKIVVDATIIIVADADNDHEGTMSGTTNTTVSLSGGNADLVWMMMRGMMEEENIFEDIYEEMPPGVSIVDVDNDNHSITIEAEVPQEPITLDDMTSDDITSGFQINQDGTKLRADTSDLGGLDLGVWGSLIPSEVILTKVE